MLTTSVHIWPFTSESVSSKKWSCLHVIWRPIIMSFKESVELGQVDNYMTTLLYMPAGLFEH